MVNKSLLMASVVGGVLGFTSVPSDMGKFQSSKAASNSPPVQVKIKDQDNVPSQKNVCVGTEELVDGGVACSADGEQEISK